jgi:hypothetical protein
MKAEFMKAGRLEATFILEKPIELKDFLDRLFIPTDIKAADITVPRDFGRD